MNRPSIDRDFDIKTSNRIKGIAIVLMLVHHYFGFPQWTSSVFNTQILEYGVNINYYIAATSKMCVSLFAFVTGWAYSKSSHRDLGYSVHKAVSMLKKYWIILFFICIPVAALCGEKKIDAKGLLNSLFATSDENICFFAWYVHFYVLAILTLPLIYYVSRKSTGIKIIILGILLVISSVNHIVGVSGIIEEYFYWMPLILVGDICGKSEKYATLYKWLCSQSAFFKVMVLLSLMLCKAVRAGVAGANLDIIYVPLIILIIISLLNSKKVSFLEFMGHYSMLIWFLHGFFYSPYTKEKFQRVMFISQNLWVSFFWFLALSIGMAVVYDTIGKVVSTVLRKLVCSLWK